ncbi:hypothetical protein BCEN4_540068 [Burkholderia cenocepacia]|nr:hypothetical protein BCEN4_540068 [Burkholderia cenocepacia]
MTVFKFAHYDTIQYLNVQAKGGFPPGRPAISNSIVGLVNTAMGSFLANVEAVLADRLNAYRRTRLHTTPSPTFHPQHGAHHHE